jgi:hypothetical protein
MNNLLFTIIVSTRSCSLEMKRRYGNTMKTTWRSDSLICKAALTFLALIVHTKALVDIAPSAIFDKGRKCSRRLSSQQLHSTSTKSSNDKNISDNKAMAFLKKIGKVGSANGRDIRFAVGVDEGQAGKSLQNGMKVRRKVNLFYATVDNESLPMHAFKSSVDSGIIDDMTEQFPTTTSGTRWDGFT